MEKQWKQWQILFFWTPKSLQMVTVAMKLRYLLLGRKAMTNLDSILKSRDISSCHMWMWELDHKESWMPKNWCFRTVVLEKTLESPLDCKEIQPVHPEGNQSWIFIGKTDVEAETPLLWPPDTKKSWLIWKDPDAGKDWRQEEKGTRWLDGGWDGWMAALTQWTWVWVNSRSWWWKGGLACCSPWGHKVGHDSCWTELRGLKQEGCIVCF